MSDFDIASESLRLTVTTSGGAVWRFQALTPWGLEPVFREPPDGSARAALKAGCFPLVPFGNRVRGNRFSHDGRDYRLARNMDWDRHYLHGDGWTGEWTAGQKSDRAVVLSYDHRSHGAPYTYRAEQSFVLEGATLTMSLSVTNLGITALPFGLGWHPYFPLTPDTTLKAPAGHYWAEDRDWLPTEPHAVSGDLDFAVARHLPRRWVNTLFEGWDGMAEITWPERRLAVEIETGWRFSRYLVFVSDPGFDRGYDYDFFCFEPMSHRLDAHNAADGGGLVRLAPGETLSGSVRLTVRQAGVQ